MSPRLLRSAAILLTCFVAGACSFDGVQSVTLPGGTGTGDDAMRIVVELPDVGTLTPNAEVKVGDVAVGTVTDLRVVDWHAEAQLSLESDVDLPANAQARVGVNSLLGSSYVELAAPPTGSAGHLKTGARIPLKSSAAYPATEQVLASASVVLNGGGLEQLATITKELDAAVSGNGLAIRHLLPRMDSFVGALNSQRGDIVAAIENVDSLATRLSRGRGTITKALDELGPALKALSEERPELTRALTSLRRLGDVTTPLVAAARADLTANLRDLVPALRALSRAGDSLARGLGYAVTFPFPTDTVENTCPSDYCNLFLTLDLTTDALINGFVTPDGHLGIPGIPGLPVGLLQNLPGVSTLPILGPLLSRNGSSAGTTSPSLPDKAGSSDGDVMGDLLTGVLSLFGTRAGGGS